MSLGPGGSGISSHSQSADVSAGNFPSADFPGRALRDGLLVGKRGEGGSTRGTLARAALGTAERVVGEGSVASASGSGSSSTFIDSVCIFLVKAL